MMFNILERMIWACYIIPQNYGIAIILFTLLTKVILLPLSLWVQYNSIKLVKMQPEINAIKTRYYGDQETIAEEQSKLFKRAQYNPLFDLVPLFIQIFLLIGVIDAIQSGINTPGINSVFLGIRLDEIPKGQGVTFAGAPILAGISAWILCVVQNRKNVLQAEQSPFYKYGTMIFTIALAVYLGGGVNIGVAVYWIASNLWSTAQIYLLNWIINPKNQVDYDLLAKSKMHLEELDSIGKHHKIHRNKEERNRERKDYKKFFRITNKHLVFYSEGNGFYKYYQGMIEYILKHTKVTIHYITSDYNDEILKNSEIEERFKTYYIGERRLITLMMKLEADVVVMTMPDLEKYHIKKSYIKRDIEYIYIPHGIGSNNMTMRTGSTDHYDTIFCTDKYQKEEHEKTEEVYFLPKRKMVEWGYDLLDQMRKGYEELNRDEKAKKTILIAPSWQNDNIIDLCLEDMLNSLKGKGYQITVRPHPQQVKMQREKIERLKKRFLDVKEVYIQTDFSSNATVFEADIMITDWSGIAYEYAFTTYKPVLFIDTPMKVMNPEYKKIGIEPADIWMRHKIGFVIPTNEVANINEVVAKTLSMSKHYAEKIEDLMNQSIYHIGESAEVGAQYIMNQIQEKIDRRKRNINE